MQAHVLLIALGQGAADLDHRGEERRELVGGVVEVRADPDPGARAVVDDEAAIQQRVVNLLGTTWVDRHVPTPLLRVVRRTDDEPVLQRALEQRLGERERTLADAADSGSKHTFVAG